MSMYNSKIVEIRSPNYPDDYESRVSNTKVVLWLKCKNQKFKNFIGIKIVYLLLYYILYL